jgi:hypothetical protein
LLSHGLRVGSKGGSVCRAIVFVPRERGFPQALPVVVFPRDLFDFEGDGEMAFTREEIQGRGRAGVLRVKG